MIASVMRRLVMSVALLLVVPAISFFISAAAPGDAVDTILGLNATAEQKEALRASLHLDLSTWERYWLWLVDFAHGDMGKSLLSGQSVVHQLNQRLPITLSLLVLATALSALLGIAAGIFATTRRHGGGKAVDTLSIAGMAIPNFWLGVVLIEIFAVSLGILPATGYVPLGVNPGLWAASLTLPVIVLGVSGVTMIAKQTRGAMIASLEAPFIRNFRANGAYLPSLRYRHALRNASVPIITSIGLVFIGALGGSIVVETVFVLPGLGAAAVDATQAHDFTMVQGVAVYFTIIVIIVNVLTDIAAGLLNPKMRTL